MMADLYEYRVVDKNGVSRNEYMPSTHKAAITYCSNLNTERRMVWVVASQPFRVERRVCGPWLPVEPEKEQ